MSEEKNSTVRKKEIGKTLLEEISNSSWVIPFLAIFTGLLLGGVIVALTSEIVYQAFSVSIWEGLKAGAHAAWETYVALF